MFDLDTKIYFIPFTLFDDANSKCSGSRTFVNVLIAISACILERESIKMSHLTAQRVFRNKGL